MWSNALCRVISVARRERVDQLINYRSPKKNSRVSFAPPSPPSLSLCLLIKPIDIFLFSTIVCRNCRQVAAPSGREKKKKKKLEQWPADLNGTRRGFIWLVDVNVSISQECRALSIDTLNYFDFNSIGFNLNFFVSIIWRHFVEIRWKLNFKKLN